jgi:hypothetical protein
LTQALKQADPQADLWEHPQKLQKLQKLERLLKQLDTLIS